MGTNCHPVPAFIQPRVIGAAADQDAPLPQGQSQRTAAGKQKIIRLSWNHPQAQRSQLSQQPRALLPDQSAQLLHIVCFPQGGDAVAKTRMAAEELYKLKKRRRVKIPKTV